MKKSLIPHILVGAVLLVGAGLWIWLVSSIDYSQLNARSSKPDNAAAVEQQVDAPVQEAAPAQEDAASQRDSAPESAPAQ